MKKQIKSKLLLTLFTLILVVGCSHHERKPSSESDPFFLKFVNSGMTQNKRHYQLDLLLSGVEHHRLTGKADVMISDQPAYELEVKLSEGQLVIQEIVPFTLSVANTKIRVYEVNGEHQDFELICNKAGFCK